MRVYVETSVWSFALADDVPDYTADTLAFFDACRAGRVSPFVSDMVFDEFDRAESVIREKLYQLVASVRPAVIQVEEAAKRLSDVFVKQGAVPPSKPEDALHVAVAFQAQLDVLVSWNFKHIANVRRADRFNAIAMFEGIRKPLRIATPSELIYDDEA